MPLRPWGNRERSSGTTARVGARLLPAQKGEDLRIRRGLLVTAMLLSLFCGGIRPAQAAASSTIEWVDVESSAPGTPLTVWTELNGGSNPTGTLTFSLYGPADPTCLGIPELVAAIPVAGNGEYSTDRLSASTVGAYQVVVRYSGDQHNPAAASSCGDGAVEISARPTLSFTPAAPVTAGGAISVAATLEEGLDPTGSLTFNLYGPNDPTCEEAPVSTSVVGLVNGRATSDQYVTHAPGSYHFSVLYMGDANNAEVYAACYEAGDSIAVGLVSPAISVAVGGRVSIGAPIDATATLSGGLHPTGSITFKLFNPGDPTCSGVAAASTTAVLTGQSASSGQFATGALGDYNFVAIYSGDANNGGVATVCGSAPVTVGRAEPAISLSAVAARAEDQALEGKATLSGAFNPVGIVTFMVFGPSDPSCGPPMAYKFTSPVINGGAILGQTALVLETPPGTYSFIAVYSGDDNNVSAATPCESNTVQIPQSPPGETVWGPVRATSEGVAIKLRCKGPSKRVCRGAEKLTAYVQMRDNVPVPVSVRSHVRPAGRNLTVGVARYAITAGKAKTIKVSLNSSGRQLRNRVRRLPVRLASMALTTTDHVISRSVASLVIKAPRKGRRV